MPQRPERHRQRQDAAEIIEVKEPRRSREPNQTRGKDRAAKAFDNVEEYQEEFSPEPERAPARGGERVRRHDLLVEALAELEEETDALEHLPTAPDTPAQRGIITEISRGLCRVNSNGRTLVCRVRDTLELLDPDFTEMAAIGDEVLISSSGDDEPATLEAVLPRRTLLAWPQPGSDYSDSLLVANADQLLILASWRDPAVRFELIDRYLIMAVRSNLEPVICINKIDLAPDAVAPRALLLPYRDLGYRVLFTSVQTGAGLKKLKKTLQNRITALVGLSGVGKSSLLAAIQPELQSQANQAHSNGKTAGVGAKLHPLSIGGFIIDTPGGVEPDLSGLHQRDLARFYPEIVETEKSCQFRDCSHTQEPGCAVKVAVQKDHMSARRYQTYKRIYYSLPV